MRTNVLELDWLRSAPGGVECPCPSRPPIEPGPRDLDRLHQGNPKIDSRWPEEYLAIRDDVEAFIHEWRTPELAAEMREREGATGPLTCNDYKALQEKGWMRMCWPREMGGEGRDPLYQFILVETMECWRMPYGNLTFTSVAPSIAQYGNELRCGPIGPATRMIGLADPSASRELRRPVRPIGKPITS